MTEKLETTSGSNGFTSVDLLLIVMTIFWAINPVVIKMAEEQFNLWAFVGLRNALASLSFIVLMMFTEKKMTVKKEDWARVIALSLVGATGVQICFLSGYKYTTASNGTLIFATTPLFIAIISRILGLEKISLRGWGGIFLSLLGTFLLVSKDLSASNMSGSFFGDMLMLIAAILWASNSLMVAPLLKEYSPILITGLTTIIGTIPLFIFALPSIFNQSWGAVNIKGWGGLVFSSIFAMLVTNIIWNIGVQKVGSVKTSLYQNVKPFITIWIVVIFFNETFSAVMFFGGLMILGGLVVGRTAPSAK